MKRILITGGSGFLGSRIAEVLAGENTVWAPPRSELDFTSAASVAGAFSSFHPTHLVHCGAVSDVGMCEKQPEQSRIVNVDGPALLARACAENGARMIFCSSDQVYWDGHTCPGHPWREGDSCHPGTRYGCQKLEAEGLCAQLCPDTVSLRLSWMYDAMARTGQHGDLVQTLRQMAMSGEQRRFACRDLRGVTWVEDVAAHFAAALELPAGVWNFGSPNAAGISALELARMGLAVLGADVDLAVPLELPPRELRMDSSRTAAAGICFGETALRLEECLRRGQ